MKHSTLKNTLVALVLLCAGKASAQFTFSVQPGNFTNGANFGYQIDKLVPYIGLQWMRLGSSNTETGRRWDNDLGESVDYRDEYTYNLSMFVPTLGAKYFVAEKNKLKAYANLNFSYAIISGKITDSNDPNAADEFNDYLKNLSVYGGQLGFGTEYFFDDNFSIGGEFGFRLMKASSKESQERTYYDPNAGTNVTTTITTVSKASLSPAYARLSLNFYFGD